MSVLTAFTALVSLAVACPLSSPVDLSGQVLPFDVNLTHLHDNTIRLAVTNLHDVGYNILQAGSLFDASPVRKLMVKGPSSFAPFHGIEKMLDLYSGDTSRYTFTPIKAGQTIIQDLDIAETHSLNDEIYSISADGHMLVAPEGSSQLLKTSLPYASNSLTFKADGLIAKRTSKTVDRMIMKRTTVESDCSADQKSTIEAANQKCASMANAAADAACSGDIEMFKQYFHSSEQSVRDQVAQTYRDVAAECGSTPGGATEGHCTDPDNNCSGDLLAYTVWQYDFGEEDTPRDGKMYYCPRYFEILSPGPQQCHQQSQATSTLHETTHAVAGTNDAAYGFDGISGLDSQQAVKNADTYALYANDIDLKCGTSGSEGSAAGGYEGGAAGEAPGGDYSGGADSGNASGSSEGGAPPNAYGDASGNVSGGSEGGAPPNAYGDASGNAAGGSESGAPPNASGDASGDSASNGSAGASTDGSSAANGSHKWSWSSIFNYFKGHGN